MNCLECSQGFHFDCELNHDPEKVCCCQGVDNDNESNPKSSGRRDGMAWSKSDASIRDLKSTGRKRAAVLFPIDDSAACEWKNLLYAGGGAFPIIGCVVGTMKHRHHGPIILTTANVEGNVHRICDSCHRIWHVCNDGMVLEFARSVRWLPHDEQTKAPVDLLTLSSVSEKLRIDESLGRFKYRPYKKAEHDYAAMLESASQNSEVVNPWLGI